MGCAGAIECARAISSGGSGGGDETCGPGGGGVDPKITSSSDLSISIVAFAGFAARGGSLTTHMVTHLSARRAKRKFAMASVMRIGIALFLAAVAAACSSGSSGDTNDGGGADAATDSDASTDDAAAADAGADVDKSASCAATFGQAIGSVGFARFDGTVVAVVPPNDQACAEPNSTHLVVQIQSEGAVYRMVVDVDDKADPGSIHTSTMQHALVGPSWGDGWHSTPLDYVTDLATHSSSFTRTDTASAVAATTAALDIGAHVSIYATAQGEADSAHLVHRNFTNADGAIVVNPEDANPTWLLFAFSDQSF